MRLCRNAGESTHGSAVLAKLPTHDQKGHMDVLSCGVPPKLSYNPRINWGGTFGGASQMVLRDRSCTTYGVLMHGSRGSCFDRPLFTSTNSQGPRTMITRTALLTVTLLLITTGVFAQVAATSTTATTSATTMASANVGQTITLSGTAYKVSAKKVLATGVEFYTVKATTPKAPAKYFLRTRDTYNPTVFTQAQYEAFLRTGKVTSFGTLKQRTAGSSKHHYMIKGNVYAAFGVMGTGLEMFEYTHPTVLAVPVDDGTGGDICAAPKDEDKHFCCYIDCTCMMPCEDLEKCKAACDEEHGKASLPSSYHRINTSKTILFR